MQESSRIIYVFLGYNITYQIQITFDYNFHIRRDLFYSSGTLGLTFFITIHLYIPRKIFIIQCIASSDELFIDVVNKLHDSAHSRDTRPKGALLNFLH
jgi:hypothetical protein